jgi:hypothetical protein
MILHDYCSHPIPNKVCHLFPFFHFRVSFRSHQDFILMVDVPSDQLWLGWPMMNWTQPCAQRAWLITTWAIWLHAGWLWLYWNVFIVELSLMYVHWIHFKLSTCLVAIVVIFCTPSSLPIHFQLQIVLCCRCSDARDVLPSAFDPQLLHDFDQT